MFAPEKDTKGEKDADRPGEKLPGRRVPPSDETRLGRLLGPTSLLDLQVQTKEDLIRVLSEAVARDRRFPEPGMIYRAALDREAVVNTYLGDGIAVPHARVPGFEGFAIAVARNRAGFPYGVETPEPVKIVILLVGDDSLQNEHVRYLAAIAAAVKDESLREEILRAPDHAVLARAMDAGPRSSLTRGRPHQMSRLLLSHARKISREVGATSVLVAIDTPEELKIVKRLPRRADFIVASSSSSICEAAEKVVDRVIRLPWAPLRRDSLVRLGTLMGISSGLITRDDVVAFLSRRAGGSLDTISIIDVGREFGRFLTSAGEISSKIAPSVLERVLILASELGSEGREGKPIGTIFVIGDPQDLAPYCQQMVINPFRGYPEEERNILDPTLRETVKEFSWLDGAFVIRGDGLIHSAGTYLRPGKLDVHLPGGFGTRHRAACAITGAVDCVSLAISQSSGNVMLFKNGGTVLTLEKGAVR
jgi:diadenylate cyclase